VEAAVPEARSVVVWVPPRERPEALREAARQAEVAKVKAAELEARAAIAARRTRQAQIHEASEKLVLGQLLKLLRLAESKDYENSPGPVELKDLIKLAELAGKDYRLDTGQATENIAMALGPSIDFSKLSQEERDAWRALAIKGGAEEE
jgi:ribosome-associated protein YbcJ (S4-like RNA binding protein)